MSCGHDKTVRVWAKEKKGKGEEEEGDGEEESEGVWREIARPCSHGYDCNDIALLPHLDASLPAHRFFLASGEKYVRAYDAPTLFLNSLTSRASPCFTPSLTPLFLSPTLPPPPTTTTPPPSPLPRCSAAYTPELGLSNRAITDKEESIGTGEMGASAEVVSRPKIARSVPVLDFELGEASVWEEKLRLFGHGDDVLSVSVSADGAELASACRARDEEGAAIRLWRVADGLPRQILPGPTSSVVALAFHPLPSSPFLLAASKDRHVYVFGRASELRVAPPALPDLPGQVEDANQQFVLVSRIKAHRRIVWDVQWSPDGSRFATASRDGEAKVFSLTETDKPPFHAISLSHTLPKAKPADAATAIAFLDNNSVLVGRESGQVQLWTPDSDPNPKPLPHFRCAAAVRGFRVRPNDPTRAVAIASDDSAVRIVRLGPE